LYEQLFQCLGNIGYKIRKEDENHLKDAAKQISNLAARLAAVEQTMEAEMEGWKKDLDKKIPQLNNLVHELTQDCQLPQYLDKNQDMTDMIKQLDAKWEKFEEYRDTASKFNGWQEEMSWQPTIFSNIEELKEQLEARRTLWRSLNDWKELKETYEKMLWNDINDDDIKRNAEAYNKTANRLIRALPANPIVDELKFLVD
jgi:dynein heavy chain